MQQERDKAASKWLREQIKSIRGRLLLSTLAGFFAALFYIAQTWMLAAVVDQTVLLAGDSGVLVTTLVQIVGVMVLRVLCLQFREIMGSSCALRFKRTLRSQIFAKFRALGPGFVENQVIGGWSTVVVEQVEATELYVSHYLSQTALVVMVPAAILVVIFPVNWAAGFILLLTAPLVPLFMILVGMQAAEASRRNFRALERLGGFFLDRLRGLGTLVLFQQAERELQALAQASEQLRKKTMQVLKLAFLSSAVLEFFSAVSIALLAVYLGMSFLGYLDFGHYGERVTLGHALFLLLLAPEFYQPLRDLGRHYHARASAVAAAGVILDLLNQHQPGSHRGTKTLPSDSPLTIDVRDVSVCIGERKLLDNLSFSVAAGERLGITGPSGAGKSTLLRLLMGFCPFQGELRFYGEPMSQLLLSAWQHDIAWLGQHPLIVHGTVFDNVSFGRDIPENQVVQALEKAQAIEIITSLPDGLNSQLSEEGRNLSVGQAQRIALARALAEPAKLLLLDEPTASLDRHNACLIEQALVEVDPSCTVVTVSHRRSLLGLSKRLLVLNAGRLRADGETSDLLSKPTIWSDVTTGVQ